MENILRYKQFLNEGLIASQPYDKVISNYGKVFDRSFINLQSNSKNQLRMSVDFKFVKNIDDLIQKIDSYFVNKMGWFVSNIILKDNDYLYIEEISNNCLEELRKKYKNCRYALIYFESKFGEEVEVPKKLYHLTFEDFEDSILKSGLKPKGISKLFYHSDRIYLCDSIYYCEQLIGSENFYGFYKEKIEKNPKIKMNLNPLILEIDTEGLNMNLYKDPEFGRGGYYTTTNIPPSRIKVVKRLSSPY